RGRRLVPYTGCTPKAPSPRDKIYQRAATHSPGIAGVSHIRWIFHHDPSQVKHMSLPTVCLSRQILNVRVDATNYADATARVLAWAQQSRSGYVCLATVNSIMEAHTSREYKRVLH